MRLKLLVGLVTFLLLGMQAKADVPAAGYRSQGDYVATLWPPIALSGTITAGTIAWQVMDCGCTVQPCYFGFWNQSPSQVLIVWFDNVTSTPAFAGESITAGTEKIIMPVSKGEQFHWRFSDPNGNGFFQEFHN